MTTKSELVIEQRWKKQNKITNMVKKRVNSNNTLAIVGTQWGDEGKGKMTDYYASNWAEVVVRSQGGNNAGHTITYNGKSHSVRSIPSGIFTEGVVNVIADGCVISTSQLIAEIKKIINECDIMVTPDNLKISNRAHIIIPGVHDSLDNEIEDTRVSKIKTTGNGIGPCYADKMYRLGIRIADICEGDYDTITTKIHDMISEHNLERTVFDIDGIANLLAMHGRMLKPYVCDTMVVLNEYLESGKKILFEGAQAAMLDITYGYYPYVTSSSPIASAIPCNCGIPANSIGDVMGIVKAYSTRVGAGPFVTEIKDEELVNKIRETGHEYGTVTGRPRRIGWLDLFQLKYSAKLNGLTEISLMLTDVLDGIDEIKVCVGYMNKKTTKFLLNMPATINELNDCEPVYEVMKGWTDSKSKTSYDDLEDNTKKYIEKIEEYLGVNVKYVSVGKDRTQTLER